jgi:hypothetical protein
MHTADDLSYFYARADAELILAQQATHPAACRAHYQLANYYLDRVYNPANDPEVAVVEGQPTAG